MSFQAALWTGIGLRLLLRNFCIDSVKTICAVSGIWNGFVVYCALSDNTILDLPVLLPIIVCTCYDITSSGSPAVLFTLIATSVAVFLLAGVVFSLPVLNEGTSAGDAWFEIVDSFSEGSVPIAPAPRRRLEPSSRSPRSRKPAGGVYSRSREKTPISRITLTPMPASTPHTNMRSHLPLSQLDSSGYVDLILSSPEPDFDDLTPRVSQAVFRSPEIGTPSPGSLPTIPSRVGSSKAQSEIAGKDVEALPSVPSEGPSGQAIYITTSSTSDLGLEPMESTFPRPVTVPLPSLTPSPMPPLNGHPLESIRTPSVNVETILEESVEVAEQSFLQAGPSELYAMSMNAPSVRPASATDSLRSGIHHPTMVPLPPSVSVGSGTPSVVRTATPQPDRARTVSPQPRVETGKIVDTNAEPVPTQSLPSAPLENLTSPIDVFAQTVDPGPSTLPVNEPPEPSIVSNDTLFESALSDGPKVRIISRAEEHRQRAREAEARRDYVVIERKRALMQARYTDAFALSHEAERLEEEIRKLHRKAERRFFLAHNLDKKTGTLDVHGLKAREALRQVETALHDVLQRGGKHLKVIVGRGKHSEGGTPILKNAITERITTRHHLPVVIDKYNPGVLHIFL